MGQHAAAEAEHDLGDGDPDPAEVPRDLVTLVKDEFEVLGEAWDEMYPHNPVSSRKEVA